MAREQFHRLHSSRHFLSGYTLASSSPALNLPPWYATFYLTDHVRKQMRLRLDSTVILDYYKGFVRTNGYLGLRQALSHGGATCEDCEP